jgi:hypothetical protein
MSGIENGIVVRTGTKTQQVMSVYITGLMIVIVGVAAMSQTPLVHRRQSPLAAIGFAAVTIVGGTFLKRRVRRSSVVLYPNAVEVTNYPWPTRRFAREEIAGRHFHPAGYRSPAYYVLETRDGRTVNVPPYLENNAEFRAFIETIPSSNLHR